MEIAILAALEHTQAAFDAPSVLALELIDSRTGRSRTTHGIGGPGREGREDGSPEVVSGVPQAWVVGGQVQHFLMFSINGR